MGPPSHDDIAKRALEIAKRRGAARGGERDDFLQAERELRRECKLPVEDR
jgi:Protein of unknown function (DUF2934)